MISLFTEYLLKVQSYLMLLTVIPEEQHGTTGSRSGVSAAITPEGDNLFGIVTGSGCKSENKINTLMNSSDIPGNNYGSNVIYFCHET